MSARSKVAFDRFVIGLVLLGLVSAVCLIIMGSKKEPPTYEISITFKDGSITTITHAVQYMTPYNKRGWRIVRGNQTFYFKESEVKSVSVERSEE